MCLLLETIRVENEKPMHLEWHQKRMDESYFKCFGMQNPFDLQQILKMHHPNYKETLKCRVVYDQNRFQVECKPYQERIIKSFYLVEAPHLDYALKYADRSHLNIIKKNLPPGAEVIILQNGHVTDTTFSNLAFFDGHQWITPETFLLNGTARQRLISESKIISAPLHRNDLQDFVSFKLINAMLPWETSKIYPLSLIQNI